MVAGNGLAQRRIAGSGPVARAPAPQTALGFIDDRCRGVEVRVADGEQDHVLTGLPPVSRLVVDVPHASGIDVEAAGEQGVAHRSASRGHGRGVSIGTAGRRGPRVPGTGTEQPDRLAAPL